MDGHSYSGIRGYSDKGGGEGWTSLDYPWMVTVTLASADTLTRGGGGGRVDIPGLSIDGHTWYWHMLTSVPVKSWVHQSNCVIHG